MCACLKHFYSLHVMEIMDFVIRNCCSSAGFQEIAEGGGIWRA
jgi:hypothetical protein